MLELKGANLLNYKKAVSLRGCSIPSSVHKITIDSTGYSPELAGIFGEDYLGNSFIIVDPEKQKWCGQYGKRFSGLELAVEKIMKCKELGEFIAKEGLYVEYEINGLELLTKSVFEKMEWESKPWAQSAIEVRLRYDTPSRMLRNIWYLEEDVASLRENPSLIMDKAFLNNALKTSKEVCRKYGSIKGLFKPFPWTTMLLPSFSLKFGPCEVFGLKKNGSPLLFIYFGGSDSFRVQHSISLNSKYPGIAVPKLLAYDYAYIDKPAAEDKMRKIEMQTLRKGGYSPGLLNALSHYSALGKSKGSLPEDWFFLEALLNKGEYTVKGLFEHDLVKPCLDGKVSKDLLSKLKSTTSK